MSETDRPKMFARGFVEVVVVIVGVVLGLAVDRWVAGIDDRARADLWAAQLSENLLQDSLGLVQFLSDFDRMSTFGVDALRLMEAEGGTVEDPSNFVLNLEMIAWWVPFEPARDTRDQIVATGQLNVFGDDDVREALVRYYGRLDFVGSLENRWGPIFSAYWALQQAAIPPLLRVGVLDRQFGLDAQRTVTPAEAAAILDAFRHDAALQGAFGTAVQTYRYGAPVLRGIFPEITAARAALQAR